MPKYMGETEMLGAEKPKEKPLDQLDKVNQILDKGLALFDKFGKIKAMREQQTSQNPAVRTEVKAEKIISNAPKPKLYVDEKKAVEDLFNLAKNIPEEYQEMTIKEAVKEAGNFKSSLEPMFKKYVEGVATVK